MIIILVAIVIGLLPASIAAAKGRNFVLWWIYGAALFIIALPHAILAKSANKLIDSQQAAAGNVKCPTCAEWIKPEAKICRFCKTALPMAVVLFFAAMALPKTLRADDVPQRPGSIPTACASASTPVCKLEFIGTWSGQWGDRGLRVVNFDKDGTYSMGKGDEAAKKKITWFVSDPQTIVIVEPRGNEPPRLLRMRAMMDGGKLVLQLGSFSPITMQRVGSVTDAPEAVPAADITLPIADPLTLFALAQKLDPKAVIIVIRSCFSVNGCQSGRKSFFDITTSYDSVFTKIPSTRIIAGLRDCARLEDVQNEFQMRDLDIETRAAVENAAASVATQFSGVTLIAAVGKYDFNQQGFQLSWKPRIKIFTGRKDCRGQEITDYGSNFPRDFYLYVDPKHLPTFVSVPVDKARTIVESQVHYSVQATASVKVNKFEKGMLDVKGTGITSGWLFSGPTSITQLAWFSDGRIVEEIPLPEQAKALPQELVPKPSLKVDSVRVIRFDVNVRVTPSKSAELAEVLKPNAYVTVTEKSPDGLWSRVKVNDKIVGWMLDSALIKNSMTEEQAAAAGEGDMSDVQPPR